MSNKECRGSVFGPSTKLTEAIAKVRNQIDNLRSDIYGIKARNPQHRVESYCIKGVLVAGLMPEAVHKRSFELFRNSLSGLSIVTFDELLAKLQSLRRLLKPGSD
ncbi:DUF4263 domain-containing protein [Sinorhizobium medicae]|nr:DUF4263 domain-containing protein [Sinorhizobium medicae]